jgi:hypothetical protein
MSVAQISKCAVAACRSSKARLNSRDVLSAHCRNEARALLMGLALHAWGPALGQNYVINPDFEQPLGTNNWTVEYIYGGPSDFSIHDRTTIAHKDKVPGTWDGHPNFLDVYGAEFQPYHDGKMHACFKQTVRGLMRGSNYVVSCWMTQFEALYTNKVQVYMEALGGPGGTTSRTTPNIYKACNNNPSAWGMYSVTNAASASGEIEVRLHFNKDKWTTLAWQYIRAYYDHVAVMLPGQTPPPFRLVSLTVTNPAAITLKWETVVNNTYDLEASANLGSWSKLRSDLLATGTSLTFRTNLAAPPGAPQLFRAASHNYVP